MAFAKSEEPDFSERCIERIIKGIELEKTKSPEEIQKYFKNLDNYVDKFHQIYVKVEKSIKDFESNLETNDNVKRWTRILRNKFRGCLETPRSKKSYASLHNIRRIIAI
ncbi:MAG: hypothetical protein AAGE84_31280 [Cyanobacteria bacterium P01_G01_bin.39]